jgi:hypothetical protein
MRFAVQNQAFLQLVAEENKIRSELQRVDAQNQAAEQSQTADMRSIGADVIWKAWVGRTKRALNIKLSQVLAQKEHHLRQVKRAYGKVLVTRQLLDIQIRSETEAAMKQQLETTTSQSLSTVQKNQ